MSVSITRGTNDKPVSSQVLIDFFLGHSRYTGRLLIGYPIIGALDGRYAIDALLVSPDQGLVVFDLVEGSDPGHYDVRHDDLANKLESRLRAHKELLDRRTLIPYLGVVTFAPGVMDPRSFATSGYPLANLDTLSDVLGSLESDPRNTAVYNALLSAIQNISTIRKSRTKRIVSKLDSRGARLKLLEDSIATLDNLQSRAVIETVDAVQRIRGLAGSGKTIVLALKAAYLHAQHPDWKIAVTFNTRALKQQFRRLINNFSIEQTGEEPDWQKLRILTAWGAPGSPERDGLYHQFCREHALDYLDFRSAQEKFRANTFAGVCGEALAKVSESKVLYDAILVDEAQDFPPQFLRLCYESLDEQRRLVYAYDELQSLSGDGLPSPAEIFGTNPDGSPKVSFDSSGEEGARRDIILEKCYRNSRPVLVTAHALGFGIYRDPPRPGASGLVQMFDEPRLWEEIGYKRKSGELRGGARVVLVRTEETSPRFLEDHSPIDDLLVFKRFDGEEDQANWVAEEIRSNLLHDELRHDDIVVINPDPPSTRRKVGAIRRRLFDSKINSHLAGVDTDPDIFFKPEASSVTFTGVHRAKGNEAGMVYIINAHDCQASALNLATVRNRLFTAITRSKAWVRVLGVGPAMDRLIEEYERLKGHAFELDFRYPNEDERTHLKVVHRDASTEERRRVQDRQQTLVDLIGELESGAVHLEDLDETVRARLRELLAKND